MLLIQNTDIIKVTTQKQGGLTNNSRAVAAVSIFTKIIYIKKVSFDAVPCFPMPSVVYSWYLSIRRQNSVLHLFRSSLVVAVTN